MAKKIIHEILSVSEHKTQRGLRYQAHMIYPSGLRLSQFISKDKYEEIKNLPEKEIETSYKFIQSETKSGKPRSQLKVQTPFLVFSRFVKSVDREKLQSIFQKEGLKEGDGFSFGKLWEMIKKYGMKILPALPEFIGDVKNLLGDATSIKGSGIADEPEDDKEGKGLTTLPLGKGLSNLPGGEGLSNLPGGKGLSNLPRGKGLSNLPRGKGLSNLPRGRNGGGDGRPISDSIAEYYGYSDLSSLSKDFPGKEGGLISTGKSLIDYNVSFPKLVSVLKDLRVLPKSGSSANIKNANILKHINKTRLKEVIRQLKKDKSGGWIVPLLSSLLPILIPPVINAVTDLIKK